MEKLLSDGTEPPPIEVKKRHVVGIVLGGLVLISLLGQCSDNSSADATTPAPNSSSVSDECERIQGWAALYVTILDDPSSTDAQLIQAADAIGQLRGDFDAAGCSA